ncbi:MAG: branched-chain amino acid ABC transporter [Candidatus Synechococcus spongiarum SP3]|uniref:Branched-chain amino acid ABC transporter n=1 Tax=Candidatus Synechococcus spongiarum SP3 TaxID=1604020 RepID=A0A0G2J3Y8_9SYNE|nr:MAG: branched-chain amino acid ABC transporter [Candidatus Synechococcus spongiarum SP3]
MSLFFESLFNGAAIGSVLLIAALGLAVVFGLMGVINLAHGELIMLGAYTTYVVQSLFKLPLLAPLFGAYIFVAVVAAFLVSGLVGLLLERSVIRRLYGRPLETLLATWGVSLILQQFVRTVPLAWSTGLWLAAMVGLAGPPVMNRLWGPRQRPWRLRLGCWVVAVAVGVACAGWIRGAMPKLASASARNVDVTAPRWLRGGLDLGDWTLPIPRLVIIGLTILAVLAVYWFLNRSLWGLRIRAVTQNRAMSDCLGIPTQAVDALTFAVGSGLAGVAGVAVSLLGSVGPNVGGDYIVGCFMVVVLGGVGNLWGAVVASAGIGVLTDVIGAGRLLEIWPRMPAWLQQGVEFFATTSMARVLVFALIVLVLQVRPAGLFPQRGRMAEV